MSEKQKRTPISELGKQGLIEHLQALFMPRNDSTLQGIGDDAAVAYFQDPLTVSAQQLALEGVDFDLSYVPLKYLGYKTTVGALGRVMAMNAIPMQLLVSVGVSQRFYVDDMDSLFSGIAAATERYNVDVTAIDVKSSYTGLTLCVSAIGQGEAGTLTRCSGAQDTDLLCLSGNVGAAYMGLQLLEREKRVLTGSNGSKQDAAPQDDELMGLKGYEYILERYLKPEIPAALLENLRKDELFPSSMCFLTDGLAHGVLTLCRCSGTGAKLFLDKIPIARQCYTFAEDWEKASHDENAAPVDPIVAALNGGDDYQMLFTLPLSQYEKLSKEYALDIIGHICDASLGCMVVTPDGRGLTLSSPGM